MKKFSTVFFILLVLLPFFTFLTPFDLMKRSSIYKPSQQTAELMMQLNKKYQLEMDIIGPTDTVWYFRDLRHHRISRLENIRLHVIQQDSIPADMKAIRAYTDDFIAGFDHKKYFNSLIVTANRDSIILTSQLK